MHAYNDDHHDNALPLQAYRQLVRICTIKRREATNHTAICIYSNRIFSRKCLFDSSIARCENVYNTRRSLSCFLICYSHARLPRSISQRIVYFANWPYDCFMRWLVVRQIYLYVYIWRGEKAKFDPHYCRHVVITNWWRGKNAVKWQQVFNDE